MKKPKKRKAVVKPNPPAPKKLWGIYFNGIGQEWLENFALSGLLVAFDGEERAMRAAKMMTVISDDGTKYYVAPLN